MRGVKLLLYTIGETLTCIRGTASLTKGSTYKLHKIEIEPHGFYCTVDAFKNHKYKLKYFKKQGE